MSDINEYVLKELNRICQFPTNKFSQTTWVWFKGNKWKVNLECEKE